MTGNGKVTDNDLPGRVRMSLLRKKEVPKEQHIRHWSLFPAVSGCAQYAHLPKNQRRKEQAGFLLETEPWESMWSWVYHHSKIFNAIPEEIQYSLEVGWKGRHTPCLTHPSGHGGGKKVLARASIAPTGRRWVRTKLVLPEEVWRLVPPYLGREVEEWLTRSFNLCLLAF